MPESDNLNNTVDAIGKLLVLFKFERILYLTVTLISFIVLISCACYLLFKKENELAAALAMFGSSGGIAFTCGRVLKMWSDAILILTGKTTGRTKSTKK